MPAPKQTITNFFPPKEGNETTKRKAEEAVDSDKESTVTKKKAKSATKATAPKAINNKKAFLSSIKTISKLVLVQDKNFKALINKDPNTREISIANYANLAVSQLRILPSLSVTEGLDFMLYLASVTATDLDVALKFCGCGSKTRTLQSWTKHFLIT